MTHICVNKLTIIGSDNGLSPGRRQAIIWTNAEILLIGPLGTNFSEIVIDIWTFSFKKNAFENVVCEMAAILSRPQWVNWIPGFHQYVPSATCYSASAFYLSPFQGKPFYLGKNCRVFITNIHPVWTLKPWCAMLLKITISEGFS